MQKLKSSLEDLDRKYYSLLSEKAEPESSTVLEFEDCGEEEGKRQEIAEFGVNGSEEVQMLGIGQADRLEMGTRRFEIVKLRLGEANVTLESQVRSLQSSLLQ